MACSLSRANRLRVLLAQSLSQFPVHRRGFAATSDVSVRVGLADVARGRRMMGSIEEKPVLKDGSEAPSAWAPDPVTGYHRPINHTPKIDPVELRQILLNHKLRSDHPTRA